jgi:AcrR family transcriptional regulator
VAAAVRLFRAQGYHATGVAEILAAAGVPKGSLYHHFPGGKPDLALAAARVAGAGVEREIARAFAGAASWDAGMAALCERIAALFEAAGGRDGCPVTGILLDGPPDPAFLAEARRILATWRAAGLAGAARFGVAPGQVDLFLYALEGAWIIARAEGNGGPIRAVPALVAPPS